MGEERLDEDLEDLARAELGDLDLDFNPTSDQLAESYIEVSNIGVTSPQDQEPSTLEKILNYTGYVMKDKVIPITMLSLESVLPLVIKNRYWDKRNNDFNNSRNAHHISSSVAELVSGMALSFWFWPEGPRPDNNLTYLGIGVAFEGILRIITRNKSCSKKSSKEDVSLPTYLPTLAIEIPYWIGVGAYHLGSGIYNLIGKSANDFKEEISEVKYRPLINTKKLQRDTIKSFKKGNTFQFLENMSELHHNPNQKYIETVENQLSELKDTKGYNETLYDSWEKVKSKLS